MPDILYIYFLVNSFIIYLPLLGDNLHEIRDFASFVQICIPST